MTATPLVGQEGVAVPPPPPAPVHEEAGDDFNPNRSRMLHRIWDMVAVLGPISRDEVYQRMQFQTGGSWRAYLRVHPEVHPKAYEKNSSLLTIANQWWLNVEIDLGVERGYLIEKDGALTIGTCPPEYEPLTTIGGEAGARALLATVDRAKAMETLEAKANIARMKPTRAGKAALRKSLETVGQLDPIVMWHPPMRDIKDAIVVNGQTRKELLEAMGVEPRIEWLPRTTAPEEVLLRRIHHEMAATSKDQSQEARDAYIATLAEQGWTPQQIADEVGLTRRRVGQVLSAMETDFHRRQDAPSEVEVAEFVALHEAGWSYRDICERTAWGKDTVRKYIKRAEQVAAGVDIEQEEADEIISKLPPTTRPATAEGRKRKAKEIKPYVEAAEKAGIGIGKVLDIATNRKARKVVEDAERSIRSQEPHEHVWVCRDCGVFHQ